MNETTGDSPTLASPRSGAGGIVAGRYQLRARLGRGATKEVYLAYDERLDREVALAIVVGAAGSPTARARVTREAQVTGRLGDHPNVITVYDTGEHDGVPYLVLRAMPGGSLAERLRTQPPSITDATRLGRDIAAALAHAHAHDVVHRDVKPDNVWLAADGSAALGDFGIAHQPGLDRLTAEGVVVGTVRYLSPEQIRGEEIGPASDLYALGVTLYELVAGRPPFQAEQATFVLTQHLTATPEPPSRHAPEIPAELEELILALLAKDAAQRPASAQDVVAALTDVPDAEPRTPSSTAPHGQDARRLVSVLAARAEVDDPEAMHGVLDRCAAVIEQHGGTVERYLGDALVGFFGLARSHGDDPLRAAQAAIELRAETAELRLGIESGEVFLATGAHGGAVATGTAISAAGRLAERAGRGEILLGEDIRHAVAADATIEPASGRLLELQLDRPALLRSRSSPFVGRARELAELHGALQQARDDEACRLVTISGPAGIGKSRLAGEFLSAIDGGATVLTGRCLAYGEGTSYRALADIVRGLGDDPRRRVEELLAGDEQAVRGILGAIGLSDEPVQAEETAWALRRLLERIARERPLVVAVEDIHWAEPALLDLLDHVVALSSSAPILLVCLTRPELLEARPAWTAPQPRRSLIVLDALDDAEARDLAAALGAAGLADRIARRAEGNPLFVEQLVAVDAGQETAELPASIQAVLAARIDDLQAAERTLLQRAAVEGRTFHSGALAVMLPAGERRGVDAQLVALTRKGLVSADRPRVPGEDAFRFTHALIREAAYAGLPKLLRAQLHAQVGEWLERRPAAEDEIVAYHFEQACLLAAELGRSGERERELAARAAARLRSAAGAALARGNPAAANALLERAVVLVGSDDLARGALLPVLGSSLYEAGRMTEAAQVLDEAIEQAPIPQVRARAEVERELVRLETDAGGGTEHAVRVADAALSVLEREHDVHGQARAWSLRAQIAWMAGRAGAADEAWRAAADCARRAGEEREHFEALGWRATASVLGPMPVDEAIHRCEEFRAIVAASPVAVVWMINPLAPLYAMKGDFELAAQFAQEASETLQGLGSLGASVSHHEAHARLIAGQYALAEVPLRAGIEKLAAMSDGGLMATTTAMLAQAVYAQGRLEEAAQLCRTTSAAAAEADIVTQVIWRSVQAKVHARRGEHEAAERLARQAAGLVEPTDLLSHRADAMLDLAEVLHACARGAQAEEALRTGLSLYEQKGNVVGATRARLLLSDNPEVA